MSYNSGVRKGGRTTLWIIKLWKSGRNPRQWWVWCDGNGANKMNGNCIENEWSRRIAINNNRETVGSNMHVVLKICSRQIVDEAPVIGVGTKIHVGGGAYGSRRQAAYAPTARTTSRIQMYRLVYYTRAIFNRCDQINICMFRHKNKWSVSRKLWCENWSTTSVIFSVSDINVLTG